MQTATIFQPSSNMLPTPTYHKLISEATIFTRFLHWCHRQEKNHIQWLAFSFLGLIGMALPCTIFSIVTLGGNNFGFWIAACAVNVPVLVINLAAQSTKITVPFLFFALAVDVAIILTCAATFLTHL